MPLYKISLRYSSSRSEAEDILQEGFLKIFRDIGQYQEKKGAFYTWAKKVVINTALEHIRKKERRPQLGELNGDTLYVKYDQDVISQLSTQELMSYIHTLPVGYRMVFNMYIIDGYSHKEISKELGISESTSKSQLFKARNKLVEMIQSIKVREYSNAE